MFKSVYNSNLNDNWIAAASYHFRILVLLCIEAHEYKIVYFNKTIALYRS